MVKGISESKRCGGKDRALVDPWPQGILRYYFAKVGWIISRTWRATDPKQKGGTFVGLNVSALIAGVIEFGQTPAFCQGERKCV